MAGKLSVQLQPLPQRIQSNHPTSGSQPTAERVHGRTRPTRQPPRRAPPLLSDVEAETQAGKVNLIHRARGLRGLIGSDNHARLIILILIPLASQGPRPGSSPLYKTQAEAEAEADGLACLLA